MSYRVMVSRDEDAWKVDVPRIGRTTMAADFGDVEDMARDLIHVMTGEDPSAITLDVHVTGDGGESDDE